MTQRPPEGAEEGAIATQDAVPEEPGKYACVLMNDDYTTMEFVIEVLQKFFKLSSDDAFKIMLKVHHEGRGVAGVYSFEVAETKAHQVVQYARAKQHPLQCNVERV